MFYSPNSGPKYKNSIVEFKNLFNYTEINEKKCLQFYYIISSDISKNFTVRLVMGDNDELQPIWLNINTNANKTNEWSLAEILLPNDAYRIRLYFEFNPQPNQILLTLDDIFIVDECKLEHDNDQIIDNKVLYWCDFEMDDCSFENYMKLKWFKVKASDNVNNGAPNDHTFNSPNGHYLTSSKLVEYNNGQIERAISPKITVPDDGIPYCVSFYYYLSSQNPSLYLFTIPLNETNENITFVPNNNIWKVYSSKGNVYNKWAWGIT
jgi:hypothetical protein